MKKKFLWTVLMCCFAGSVSAQNEPSAKYHNYPIVITLQFHCFTLPFRDIKSNFKNVGIGIGTEVSMNGDDNWAQQFTMVWYHNKALGNGLIFYTQSAWRPTLASEIYTEVKFGAGYLYSFRPVKSFKQVDGDWVSVGKKGKGMLTIPTGVSLGYHNYSSSPQFSPFASYQFLLTKGYNKSIPIVPSTLVQVGMRIHNN